MDTIKEFDNLSAEEQKQLADSPIWMALLAAYTQDGKVSENEKAASVKLAHLRTFTSAPELNEYYKLVDQNFEERFEAFHHSLPENEKERIAIIESKIKESHALIEKLDEDIAYELEKSLESFYRHVFNADKSFFQYFALPIISSKLEKESGKYDFDEED